jgi:hypothetical protein
MKSLRLFVLACYLALCGTLLAQTSASISGTVSDPSGASVQDATVTATEVATGAVRSGKSNATGLYSIPNLAPGNYVMKVEKEGFRATEFKGVPLTVAQTLVINVRLALGTVEQSVEVNGESVAPIETDTSQLSTLVDSKTMTDLPLLTRNPYELVLLSPGAIQPNNGSNGFAVNGSRDRNNNFLLDGVDNNDTSVPGGGTGIVGANPDATQEFRVITNDFNAEYGRNTGAIIDVITRGGSNNFHGDGYWFGRYNALGARDFFNRIPKKQDPYVRNDFGFSLGGPIIKNRTFFFLNNEYQRFRTTVTRSRTVPTAAFKSGLFTVPARAGTQTIDLRMPGAPGNLTGLGLDPEIGKLLNLLPNPNGGDVIPGVSGTLTFASPDNLNAYNWTGKIDHKLTEKHQLALRYAFGRSVESNQGHFELGPGLDLLSTPSYQHGIFAGLTSTLSNNLINDFKFGWNKNYAAFSSNCMLFNRITGVDPFGNGVDFQVPDAALLNGPINAFGCNTLFDAAGQARNTGTTGYTDIVTWVKANHTIKFGGDFRNVRSLGNSNFNSRSLLFFNRFSGSGFQNAAVSLAPSTPSNIAASVQDLSWFLVGGVLGQFQAQFYNRSSMRTPTDTKDFRQHEFAGFIQDTWKLASNLTLNYGLRYQFNGVPFETGGNFANLFQNPDSFATSYTFSVVGPGTGHQMYSDDYKNFEPRIGVAWDPFRDGKTSIRAGYGIFHDRIFDNLFGNARSNPPFQGTFLNFPSTLLTPEQIPAPPTLLAPGPTLSNGASQIVTLLDPNIRQPESQNWNFGMQRALPGGAVLELNYVGSHGTHVIRVLDAVPPDPALIQRNIASCVAQGGCQPGDPQGVISGPALYGGINQSSLIIPPSIRETALQTSSNFPVSNITRTNADSKYHALQAKVTKRLSHGLQLGGAYTWSHAIDDSNDPLTPEAGVGSFPVDSRNPNRVFRGNSDNDIRHRGVVDFSYELPFGTGKNFLSHGVFGKVLEGIQIAGIVSAQTGHPYTIFTNVFDNGRTGVASFSYPDVIGNPFASSGPRISANGVRTGASNVAGFSNTFLGHIGNSGRNQFYGPRYTNADMVLMKNIRITERYRMQIRSEFFNLLNHPQFQQPDGVVEDTNTFGLSRSTIIRPDATTSARQIQLALKLLF